MELFAFCEGGMDNADSMQLPMVDEGPSVKTGTIVRYFTKHVKELGRSNVTFIILPNKWYNRNVHFEHFQFKLEAAQDKETATLVAVYFSSTHAAFSGALNFCRA